MTRRLQGTMNQCRLILISVNFLNVCAAICRVVACLSFFIHTILVFIVILVFVICTFFSTFIVITFLVRLLRAPIVIIVAGVAIVLSIDSDTFIDFITTMAIALFNVTTMMVHLISLILCATCSHKSFLDLLLLHAKDLLSLSRCQISLTETYDLLQVLWCQTFSNKSWIERLPSLDILV